MSRLPQTPLEVTVDGFTHGGDGVARIDGKAVFVPGALPGEHVRVRVVHDRKRWARAELLDVLVPADDRVAPPCPHAADCGGCDLQHVTPSGQLALKTRVVREQLQRIGRIEDPPVEACVAVGPALGYRSLARMHGDASGRLGFHRHGSNEVVPIDRCPVLTDAAQSVRDALGDQPGVVEAALHATSTGDRAAVLTTAAATHVADPPPDPPADLGLVVHTDDGARHVVQGSGTVTEHVAGLDLTVSAGGFFQANVAGAAALVEAVLEDVAIGLATGVPGRDGADPDSTGPGRTRRSTAGPGSAGSGTAASGPGGPTTTGAGGPDRAASSVVRSGALRGVTAWDLYAGVGLFSLPLARAGAQVVAVEVVDAAVRHLDTNAARAGLGSRVLAITGDVAGLVAPHAARPDAARPDAARRDALATPPDVVVLDPPRTGAGPDVVAALAEAGPACIVYVACDPAALARDAKALVQAGYRLDRVRPFDLFPMTHHVEVVARFGHPRQPCPA